VVFAAHHNEQVVVGLQVAGDNQEVVPIVKFVKFRATEITEGYADQLLSNVKTIRSNTYAKEDGSYNVYVCVEMSEEGLSRIHKKLTDDQKLSIDFAEHQFKQEMEKAKEDYRSRR
jgi:hypothetical protein